MFDVKFLASKKKLPLLEYIQELNVEVEQHMNNHDFGQALRPALELRHIVYSHFSSTHIYRAQASMRIGFLYYLAGLWKESRSEIKRALTILDRYEDSCSKERFKLRHLFYHVVNILGNKEEIIQASEELLHDPNLNTVLEIRIYLNLARQYSFGKGKNIDLTLNYLNRAKYLLTVNNKTEGADYFESLYLTALYAVEINDTTGALKTLEQLQGMIEGENQEDDKIFRLQRSTERLIRVLEQQVNTEPNEPEVMTFVN